MAQAWRLSKTMAKTHDRKEDRVNVVKHARVAGAAGVPSVRCVIRDASPSGCRIISDELWKLPDDVVVHPQGLSRPITGRIVWRGDDCVGVRFDFEQARQTPA